MLLRQPRTVLTLLMKVLLLRVFCVHSALLPRKKSNPVALFLVVARDARLAFVYVSMLSGMKLLVLYLYLWSQVVPHVSCTFEAPQVLERPVVKSRWRLYSSFGP